MIKTPYMKARDRESKKEIEKIRKYIKKIWGNNIHYKKSSCKELRELGNDLGMNIFNTKKFKSQYFKKKKNKIFMRVCRRCNKYHKVKRTDGIHPRVGLLCENCRKKVNDIKGEKLKLGYQEEWKKKIMDILKEGDRFAVSEIAKKLGCTSYPVNGTIKVLAKEKKIKISKIVTVKIV